MTMPDPTDPAPADETTMPDEELNERIAREVFGWRTRPHKYSSLDPGSIEWFDPTVFDYDQSFRATRLPEFSTDISEAWMVEEELFRRDLHRQYVAALSEVVDAWSHGDNIGLWREIHATPRQRCLAALSLDPAAKGPTHAPH
jgi:hypothetical protein